MAERDFTTRRMSIVEALAIKLKAINGTDQFRTDLDNQVEPRIKFWDEVEQFPSIHLNAGSETRIYQGSGTKDRFLLITLRCYVNEEDSVEALEGLLEDVETVVEENSRLAYSPKYGVGGTTQQISIVSIDTDEGALEPLGVGEVIIEVRY